VKRVEERRRLPPALWRVAAATRAGVHNLSLSLVAGALDDSPAKGGSMASSGKPKTTRAKLQREAVLRERRLEKAARKQVRKQAQLDPSLPDEFDPGAPETGVDASVPMPEPPASI
jgi:hypothetical protein